MPEELRMEVHSTVQEVVTKTTPKKKKCKRERERYTQLNAEFQRIARGEKKAFLDEQCKEIEENNRMGKTRCFFHKIGDIKGTFHARMGTIKNRKSKALTEAEKIMVTRIYRTTFVRQGHFWILLWFGP